MRLLREGDLRWWLAIGALLGLGLETKETIVGPGIGIAVALLVTPLRSQLCTRWPWCGFLLALDLYAPAFGLPSVISPSLTYWYWKPAHLDAETVIAVGASETGMRRLYRQVQVVDRIRSVAGVRNEEVGRLILVCRDPITSLDEAWPRLRSLN